MVTTYQFGQYAMLFLAPTRTCYGHTTNVKRDIHIGSDLYGR
ncbi:hypothetical protein ACVPOR_03870 [Staphylococcus aureus]